MPNKEMKILAKPHLSSIFLHHHEYSVDPLSQASKAELASFVFTNGHIM